MKISYDTVSYDAAIDYVWRNNRHFASGERFKVKAVLDGLIRRAGDEKIGNTSTAGFMVVFHDEDEGVVEVDITVDASVSSDQYNFITQEL